MGSNETESRIEVIKLLNVYRKRARIKRLLMGFEKEIAMKSKPPHEPVIEM